jgi:hypothetical protein
VTSPWYRCQDPSLAPSVRVVVVRGRGVFGPFQDPCPRSSIGLEENYLQTQALATNSLVLPDATRALT